MCVTLKATWTKRYISRVAMRRVDSPLLSTRCTLRLPSGSRTFDVFRRATCVAFGPGADIDDRVPPIHPAMTFKYFRTRRGVPSLLPRARDVREKLADVRWMRNRRRCQCFPN